MITMSELLENSVYRTWLLREPDFSPWNLTPTWRLWVQKHYPGKWAYKDFEDYGEAIQELIKFAPKYHNLALPCRKMPFDPPLIERKGKRYKLKIPDKHVWCGYCRRPTVFRRFNL